MRLAVDEAILFGLAAVIISLGLTLLLKRNSPGLQRAFIARFRNRETDANSRSSVISYGIAAMLFGMVVLVGAILTATGTITPR